MTYPGSVKAMYKWQYMEVDQWMDYDEETNTKIDAAFASGGKTVPIDKNGVR